MQTIGDYVVHRTMGEGATGKVYEAEHQASGRRVALKVMHAELGRSADVRTKLTEELGVLTRLEHPNVVHCLSCQEVDGRVVLSFELLEGQTLRSRLTTTGRMDWRDAARMGAQIAHGLAAAHALEPPMVHRDLKPENIFVVAGNTVKVTDFGIAKVLGAAGQTTTAAFGNIKYMSPEQIDAWGIDARSDIYCLGLLLYELLTGDLPFTASNPRDLLNAQCTQPPPPFSPTLQAEAPADLERVVRYMLEKAADARPQSATQVAELLEAILQGQPVEVPQAGAVTNVPAVVPPPQAPVVAAAAPSASKSAPVGAIAAAVIAGVAVLGGGGYFLLSGDDDATAVATAESGSQSINAAGGSQTKGKSIAKQPQPETKSATKAEVKEAETKEVVEETPTVEVPEEEPPEVKLDVGSQEAVEPEPEVDPAEAMLLGSHTCGVHWLRRYGKCTIFKKDGKLKIKGSQNSSGDFFRINGSVSVKSDRTFIVNGTIDTRVSSCCGRKKLSGSFKFSRSGGRKYWRLQDPARAKFCDPFKVCMYYIDIFKKKKG